VIEIFEGRLGGGKTYSAVVRIVDHVRRGGLVCTNVEIKWDAIKTYCADKWAVLVEDDQVIKLADEEIGEFFRHTPSGTVELPVLVVVDEAHLNFNARDWNKSSRELLSFLTQSRKVSTDIIFISQSADNIDKQFRRLVQYVWRFRDMKKFKIAGLGVGWPLDQILICQYDYDGKTMLHREFVGKDKRIFGLYNTNSLLRQFPRLEGQKTKRVLKKTDKPKKPMFKYVLIIVAIAGVVAFVSLRGQMGKKAEVAEKKQEAPGKTPGVTPAPGQPARSSALAAYEIYDETFRAWNGPDRTLQTESAWYTAGEMSPRGYVVAVSPERARLALPDGRTGWVVASARSAAAFERAAGPTDISATGIKGKATPVPIVSIGSPDRTSINPLQQTPAIDTGSTARAPQPTPPNGRTPGGYPLDKLSKLPRRIN